MNSCARAVAAALSVLLVGACSSDKNAKLLDPDRPITVTVWHYYNGSFKESFDRLVAEFNETVGMERGIVVDAQSQGDVNQLASAVFDAANKAIGAAPMPNVFASYPDNAFRVNQTVKLVELERYFSAEELSEYRPEFLEEGRFITDDKHYIVPIAKSSENLFVNKNYWEAFASRHGFADGDLATWEGLVKVAGVYKEETGRGFFGVDANANYMLVSAVQLGEELFVYSKDGTAAFRFREDIARKIWDNFYIPYMYGYFEKSGRFSSDDAKKGAVLAYTGSSAGAAYFPKSVAFSDTEVRDIDPLVLPYPHFADGKPVAIQQGAGMCIAGSDAPHDYAASLFLKWFTDTEQNLDFAVSTGYFPAKTAAIDGVADALSRGAPTSASIAASIAATLAMFRDYTLYNSKPFHGSFDARVFLESVLIEKIGVDLETLRRGVRSGGDRTELLRTFTSEDSFAAWYASVKERAELVLEKD